METEFRCSNPAFAHMAFYLVRAIYKTWPTTSSWVTMPYFQMQEKFRQGCRYDALGNWRNELCAVDPETRISRDMKKFLSTPKKRQIRKILRESTCFGGSKQI